MVFKKYRLIIFILFSLFVGFIYYYYFCFKVMDFSVLKGSQVIRSDSEGNGNFLARRGSRKHKGIDLVVLEGDSLIAPENGSLVRVAYPDGNDLRKKGLLFVGNSGLQYKIFYVTPNKLGAYKIGDEIGVCQSVSYLYSLPNMVDHVHLELRTSSGLLLNPFEYLKFNL